MTQPEGKPKKPCAGCGDSKPIYTDGEDFFKWDPAIELYRAVDYKGDFYPIDTHPGASEVQLVQFYQNAARTGQPSALRLATEHDILWRTFALVVDVLVANNML